MALSDSLARIKQGQKAKEGEGQIGCAEGRKGVGQSGGEGDPDSEATSALVRCGPDVDEQIQRRWVRDRGMEKKERLCEPTAAGWNF